MTVTLPDIGFDFDVLIAKAVEQMAKAYCPYSKYEVGCALLSNDNVVFGGSNVENASYPAGICAERTAISYAVSTGCTKFKAMVVATKDGGSCCGICRQFCREFFTKDVPIIFVNSAKQITQSTTMDGILPNSFGPENLN